MFYSCQIRLLIMASRASFLFTVLLLFLRGLGVQNLFVLFNGFNLCTEKGPCTKFVVLVGNKNFVTVKMEVE